MSRQGFKSLREGLLRAGIAPRHARRILAELRDHFDDIVREEMTTGLTRDAAERTARVRIGSDDALTAAALARPELRAFAVRYPWAVFGIGSVAMLVMFVTVAVGLEGGFAFLHLALVRDLGNPNPVAPEWMKQAFAIWNWLTMYTLPVAAAAVLSSVGIRQRMSVAWILLGIALVCTLGSFHEVGVTWADVPGASSRLNVGFGLVPPFPRDMIAAALYRVPINIALAGAVYYWWLHRAGRAVAG